MIKTGRSRGAGTGAYTNKSAVWQALSGKKFAPRMSADLHAGSAWKRYIPSCSPLPASHRPSDPNHFFWKVRSALRRAGRMQTQQRRQFTRALVDLWLAGYAFVRSATDEQSVCCVLCGFESVAHEIDVQAQFIKMIARGSRYDDFTDILFDMIQMF